MLRKRFLISAAMVSIAVMFTACGKQEPQQQQGSSENEIVLSNDNKEDPDDEESDVLEKPDEASRINVKAVVVGDCTGIGFAPIMGWGEKDKNHEKYELAVKDNAEEAAAALESGEADVAILPLDTAVRRYNDKKDIVMLATNTYNNLYITDLSGEITEKSMLSGKTVAYADDGSLTASAAKLMLESCGAVLQPLESNEAIKAGVIDGSIQLSLMPEPYVTLAKFENDDVQLGPDLTEVWKDVDDGSEIISSVLVARKSFAEENKDSMVYILDDFRQSVNTVIYGITKTLEYSAKFNIVADKSLAVSTMRNCGYTFTEGVDMWDAVDKFIRQNSDAFEGNIPDKDFYYVNEND
ncbi:MAG: hypothetical protein IJR59_05720 [Firmicutes bacterium]|nr:hypothetical protein [Bacillota bacterium]